MGVDRGRVSVHLLDFAELQTLTGRWPWASGLAALSRPEGYTQVVFFQSIADVVLVDQRRAGRSTPQIACQQTADLSCRSLFDTTRPRDMRGRLLIECGDRWLQAGIDLPAYNTIESAADVDVLSWVLGYRRISVIGSS